MLPIISYFHFLCVNNHTSFYSRKLNHIKNGNLYLGGRPYGPVLIDGEKQQHNEWRQEDGSLLTYFNWYPNEPSGDGNCIQLCTGDKWCDVRCDLIQRVRYCCEE